MIKDVIVDLDGVFFDWHKSLERIVREEHPNYRAENVKTYDFNKSLDIPNLYEHSAVQKVVRKNAGLEKDVLVNLSLGAPREYLFSQIGNPRVYADAEAFKGARDSIVLLLDNPEFRVIFNTATGFENGIDIAKIKLDRLNELFPTYELNVQVTMGKEKPVFTNAFAVVDDSLGHCINYENYVALGSVDNLFLINHSFNQEEFNPTFRVVFKQAQRVQSLKEAVENILIKG